jgi:hypothetical protein
MPQAIRSCCLQVLAEGERPHDGPLQLDEFLAVQFDLAEDSDHACGSPAPECLDRLTTHGGVGAAFDGLVCAFAVASQFTNGGHGVLLSCVDNVVGAELFGHLQPRGLDVESDDPSAEGLGQQGAAQAHGPLPEDRHSLVGGQTDPLDRSEGRPGTTRDSRTGLERERAGQADERVRGNLHEVRMPTVAVQPAVYRAPVRTVLCPA